MAGIAQVISSDSASGAQVIDGSLKFDGSKFNYLNRTPLSSGNRKTWTWSGWVQKTGLGTQSFIFSCLPSGSYFQSYFSADRLYLQANSPTFYVETTRVFRDLGWYHIVIVLDTPQTAATDRLKLYVNGEEVTSFGVDQRSSLTENSDLRINDTESHSIGSQQPMGAVYANFNLSQVYFIDGQALGPESFGFTDPLTNTWRPKKFSGDTTYPNNININFSSSLSASSGFNASYPANNAFDGNLESFASSAGGSQYLELSSSFTGVTSLRIQCAAGSGFSMGGETYTISGTGITSKVISTDSEAKSLTSISLTSTTISGIRVTSSSGLQARIVAIEINGIILKNNAGWGLNGFYLPMDGNSPIGHDLSNPNPINNGSVWSSTLTSSTGFRASEPATNAFDGSTSTVASAPNSGGGGPGDLGGIITFTSPVKFPSTSSIRVWLNGAAHNVTVNGGATQSISHGSFQTVNYTNSGNSTFVMTFQRPTSADTGVRAIEIDGVVLVDGMYGNGWTPVNFGGSVALDNPQVSGARPILNTTQGGTQAGVGVFGSKENKYYTVTTANGSVYQFDITSGNNPSLSFIRGATYKFDYSSHTGHPVLFSSTNPDSSTTAYTDGTSIASNVMSFTVPHNAPDTLYYYCSAHPTSMNGSISVTTDETKADPYAWKNVLALPFLSDANDVSNSVNNGSTTKTTTVSSAVSSSAASNFYSGSYYFNGSSYVNVDAQSELSLQGDFTIECWTYIDTNVSNGKQFSSQGYYTAGKDGNWYFGLSSSGGYEIVLYTYDATGNAEFVEADLDTPAVDKWYHIAAVRIGTTVTLYVDGVAKVSGTISKGLDDGQNSGLTLGRLTVYGSLNGYIQDARIYNGVGKYTSNFVVPATSPDVLPDTPSGVSGSSKLTKITDGAVSFDGTGDYLTLAQSNDFDLTGDYTYEAFIYYTDTSGNPTIFDFSAVGGNYEGRLQIQSGVLHIYDGGWSSRGAISANTWHHIAVTQAKVYVDGIDVGASSGAVSGSNYKVVTIGARTNNGGTSYGDYFTGQISNVRIVNGTALYTSNFTPPTRALTNVTNTKLLCCQSNIQAGSAPVAPNVSGFNNGTQWSSGAGPNFESANPATNGFNGDADSYTRTDNANVTATVTLPSPVAFSSTLKVRAARDSGNGTITVNGVNVSSQFTSSSATLETVTITGVTSPLTSIALTGISGSAQPRFSAIYIDDVMLVDPLTPNGDAAATNFNPFNTDINTVRGQETGYPTYNLLDKADYATLTSGNLTVESAVAAWNLARSTQFVSTGKYYWEFKWYGGDVTASSGYQMGLKTPTSTLTAAAEQAGSYAFQYTSIYLTAGSLNTVGVSPGSVSPGDCVMFAYDADAGLMWFGTNGKWNDGANPATGSNSDWTSLPTTGLAPFAGVYGTSIKIDVNFGQKPFKYAPPDGFQPINLANTLPETVFARPDQFVGVSTWTGDGNSGRLINIGMQPDLVWYKMRSDSVQHELYDSVRGVNKGLIPNAASQEYTYSNRLLSFVYNGFTVGDAESVNENSTKDYVGWSWKAGGNENTFNVDDVGYASAADVNMSVGALNSSAYNTSETWTTASDANAKAFDGSKAYDSGANRLYGDSTLHTAIDAATTFTNVTSVIVGVSENSGNITIDGTAYSTTYASALGLTVTNPPSTVKKIEVFGRSSGLQISYVMINGVVLVDNGVTPSTNIPSIAPLSASIGTKQGFSIVRHQGNGSANQSIAHGLTQRPDFSIFKNIDSTYNWVVYHKDVTTDTNKVIYLNTTAAVADYSGSNRWWYYLPDDRVFYVGDTSTALNNSTDDMISYHWHDVPGLQKFGSFIANADTNGPFVELGFRPSIVWVKAASSAGDMTYASWLIVDGQRSPTNPVNKALFANKIAAEGKRGNGSDSYTDAWLDILSNGFKIRYTGTEVNGVAAQTYIYCAWAEAPTVNLYGGQSNGR